MADSEGGEIRWYSPNPRAIFPLDGLRVSKSLRRTLRSHRFEVRTDTAFEAVMRACAAPRADDSGSWIDERLIEAYVNLHRLGFAHSVEAWIDGDLVGGLYGVHVRGAFFGESMFSRPDSGGTDASKVSLVYLVETLRASGFSLLDTQFSTDHLSRMGCIEISRAAYLERLEEALSRAALWPDSLSPPQ